MVGPDGVKVERVRPKTVHLEDVRPKQARLRGFVANSFAPTADEVAKDKEVEFLFERYPEVLADHQRAVSDHCPVRVWFE